MLIFAASQKVPIAMIQKQVRVRLSQAPAGVLSGPLAFCNAVEHHRAGSIWSVANRRHYTLCLCLCVNSKFRRKQLAKVTQDCQAKWNNFKRLK